MAAGNIKSVAPGDRRLMILAWSEDDLDLTAATEVRLVRYKDGAGTAIVTTAGTDPELSISANDARVLLLYPPDGFWAADAEFYDIILEADFADTVNGGSKTRRCPPTDAIVARVKIVPNTSR